MTGSVTLIRSCSVRSSYLSDFCPQEETGAGGEAGPWAPREAYRHVSEGESHAATANYTSVKTPLPKILTQGGSMLYVERCRGDLPIWSLCLELRFFSQALVSRDQ